MARPGVLSKLRQSMRRHGFKRQRRISAILRDFSNRAPSTESEPTIGDLAQAFGARAFGAFFIVFGGLNLVPLPPGGSLFLGVPLLLFTAQLAVGRSRPWLPARVRRITVTREKLAIFVGKLGPYLRRAERLARQRYWPAPERERPLLIATGIFCLLMATLVAIPFPLTNMLPGVAVAVAGIAITTRDGIWLAAAFLLGLIGVALLIAVYGAAVLAVIYVA